MAKRVARDQGANPCHRTMAPNPEIVMSYRSILCFLGPDRHCASRTEFAIQLARDIDCHLVGAAPTGVLPLTTVVGLEQGAAMEDLHQKVWDAMVAGSRRRVDDFRAACRQAGLQSFEALVDET